MIEWADEGTPSTLVVLLLRVILIPSFLLFSQTLDYSVLWKPLQYFVSTMLSPSTLLPFKAYPTAMELFLPNANLVISD